MQKLMGDEGGGGVCFSLLTPSVCGSRFKGFLFLKGGGGGIEGVRTPSPKPWFVHGNYSEDFQNERKNALQVNMPRQSRTFWLP